MHSISSNPFESCLFNTILKSRDLIAITIYSTSSVGFGKSSAEISKKRSYRRGALFFFSSINVPLRLRFLLFVPIGHRDIARSHWRRSISLFLRLSLSQISNRSILVLTLAFPYPFDASARLNAQVHSVISVRLLVINTSRMIGAYRFV